MEVGAGPCPALYLSRKNGYFCTGTLAWTLLIKVKFARRGVEGMTGNEIFFGLITAAIIVLVIFLARFIVRLTDTAKALRGLIESADQALKDAGGVDQALREAIGEVSQNLRSLRAITDDVSVVTGDLKSFSGSVRDVGRGVQGLAENVKQISDLVQDLGKETVASACGLRAGIKAGFEVFLRSLLRT
jgi:methyl-accepting chemotaxis protein